MEQDHKIIRSAWPVRATAASQETSPVTQPAMQARNAQCTSPAMPEAAAGRGHWLHRARAVAVRLAFPLTGIWTTPSGRAGRGPR
jgi:hypothetical protein